MKLNPLHSLSLAALLFAGSAAQAATLSNTDPQAGGVGYAYTIGLGANDTTQFSNHVGAWSWEDNALFNAANGEPPVGWTHTSRWVALTLEKETVLTITLERDATVPWPSAGEPARLADTSSMFPSFTIYNGWDNDDGDLHTYNNRGNVSWAEDITYRDHFDNSTATSITRSYILPAGQYSIVLGSNAPANNTNRQGFKATLTTARAALADTQPGGIGYAYTVIADATENAVFSNHVGAWSWEDNALFNAANGEPPVGWTHTSRWVALRLKQETVVTIALERDATVPWPSAGEPGRLADTSSMFPSFTIYNGWDNDDGDLHTYNNRGNVSWAEDITYRDHFDNSTATSITRSYILPAGDYSIAMGSNAPANNTNRQGFKAKISTARAALADVQAGGIGYAYTVLAGANDSGTFSNHVGAWSWEDNALFNAANGEPPVGWTHTSRWVALSLEKPTVFTLTLERDATVPWPSAGDPARLADTSSMFPSFTIYNGWDNDDGDLHTYNNRGNVSWAEDITYRDHYDNSTATSITRSYILPAGQYSIAIGSNAPANNTNRQGFKATYSTTTISPVDPVPNTYLSEPPYTGTGGVGYGYTIIADAGESGSFSDHVGAWSWEDEALFNPGQNPVGWTHTSQWVAVKLNEDALFTLTLERDATVPWPSPSDVNRKADTRSMFPSLTLFRGWDNDGGDNHTYNNRGNVSWAEDLRYIDHVDNSTQTTITRTWRLPAGEYSVVLGSNAPANNTNRQGFKASFSTLAIAPVAQVDPVPNTYLSEPPYTGSGGVGYTYTISAGPSSSGSFSDHVGAWSWEDNALFNVANGEAPVGWTHTSCWVALNLTEPLTFTVTMSRDANVPWPSPSDVNRKADTSSMFPSLTLWRGWDNDGGDDHTYNNRGNVAWAEDLSYVDHYNNSSQESITRSWTLPAGNYSLALGSNAPSNNSLRQGFSFAYSTSAPTLAGPRITRQPVGVTVLAGRAARLGVAAVGPDLTYQWFQAGNPVAGATSATLSITAATAQQNGLYSCEVRNAAAWVRSNAVLLKVLSAPSMGVESLMLPDAPIWQKYQHALQVSGNPSRYTATGLPRGLTLNPTTGVISGRPLNAGTFTVNFAFANAAGVLRQSATLNVLSLPQGISGQFTGLFERSAAWNQDLGGRVQIQVTSTGAFTATTLLGTRSHAFTGNVDMVRMRGLAKIALPRPQGTRTLTFYFEPDSRSVTGTLTDGSTSLPFSARLPEANAAALANYYTFALAPETPSESVPQGYSYGAALVKNTGLTSGVVCLADGSKVTFSQSLEQGGNLSLFQTLYVNQGSFLGQLRLADNLSGHITLTESRASWLKKGATTGRLYRAGFGPVQLSVVGGALEGASNVASEQRGALTFEAGGVVDPETTVNTAVTVDFDAGTSSLTGPNPGQVTWSLALDEVPRLAPQPSASLKGSFRVSSGAGGASSVLNRTASFQGILVNDGETLTGYGYFLLPQSPLATSAILSGNLTLELVPDVR